MVRSLQRTAKEFSGLKLCVYLSPVCGACVNGSCVVSLSSEACSGKYSTMTLWFSGTRDYDDHILL